MILCKKEIIKIKQLMRIIKNTINKELLQGNRECNKKNGKKVPKINEDH